VCKRHYHFLVSFQLFLSEHFFLGSLGSWLKPKPLISIVLVLVYLISIGYLLPSIGSSYDYEIRASKMFQLS